LGGFTEFTIFFDAEEVQSRKGSAISLVNFSWGLALELVKTPEFEVNSPVYHRGCIYRL